MEGTECPDEARYLVEWAYELHGRSGYSMDGHPFPVSYTTIADWSRLLGIDIEPHEVTAVLMLDAALLNPDEPKADGAQLLDR